MSKEKKLNNWGGKREGAGRKKLPVGMKRLPRKFYLDDRQYEIVKQFVIELKKGVKNDKDNARRTCSN